jgi:DUF4097 and DUF4098 domain-containing protein YvlB
MDGTVAPAAFPNGTGRGKKTRLPMTPARIAALAIGVPVCLALTGFGGLSLVAQIGQGQFPVHEVVPVSGGQVSAHLGGGDVLIRQDGTRQATLTGTAHYSLWHPAFTVQRTAGAVTFGYNCRTAIGNCSLDSTLSVPARTAVSVSTEGGNATITGTTGAVTVSSGGGDLAASHTAGNLTLSTDGGNISGTALTAARVTANTSGGDIQIEFASVPQDVTVHTDGGSVTIIVPRGATEYKLSAHSDGGTVTDNTVPTNPNSQNTITASSSGGDVTIREAP